MKKQQGLRRDYKSRLENSTYMSSFSLQYAVSSTYLTFSHVVACERMSTAFRLARLAPCPSVVGSGIA